MHSGTVASSLPYCSWAAQDLQQASAQKLVFGALCSQQVQDENWHRFKQILILQCMRPTPNKPACTRCYTRNTHSHTHTSPFVSPWAGYKFSVGKILWWKIILYKMVWKKIVFLKMFIFLLRKWKQLISFHDVFIYSEILLCVKFEQMTRCVSLLAHCIRASELPGGLCFL